MWSAQTDDQSDDFRPIVRDVLGFFTHPFPSRDGNRRSFIEMADVRRIPQNNVAPFRMESRELVEIDWSKMKSTELVTFIGKFLIMMGTF